MTRHIHINPVIYEAQRILADECALIFRIVAQNSPVDLIALHTDRITLIRVIRSRYTIADAKAAVRKCLTAIRALQAIGNPAIYEKEIWIFSRPCGWRFYRVFPGGLWAVKHAAERADPDEIVNLTTAMEQPGYEKNLQKKPRSPGAQLPGPGTKN